MENTETPTHKVILVVDNVPDGYKIVDTNTVRALNHNDLKYVDLPYKIIKTEKTKEYIVKTLVFPAWQSAATAFKMFPPINTEYDFEQYWNNNKHYLLSLYDELLK